MLQISNIYLRLVVIKLLISLHEWTVFLWLFTSHMAMSFDDLMAAVTMKSSIFWTKSEDKAQEVTNKQEVSILLCLFACCLLKLLLDTKYGANVPQIWQQTSISLHAPHPSINLITNLNRGNIIVILLFIGTCKSHRRSSSWPAPDIREPTK
jgi:hypothetical protein